MTVDEVIEAAQADFFWVPPDVHTVARPEIEYTWSDHDSVFFNSVVKVRPKLADPAALVAEVLSRHEGRRSRWSLNVLSDTAPMRAALQAGGYEEGDRHHAYVLDPRAYARRPDPRIEVRRVASLQDLLELYRVRDEIFDMHAPASDAEIANELRECTAPGAQVARYLAYVDGEPAGTGGLTFFDRLDFAFIWAGGVREAFRGRGVYTALLRARADDVRDRGLSLFGLYAKNTTSGPIVAAHGFTRHGHMIHWSR